MKKKREVFILSDATGLTAEMAVNATMSQFRNIEIEKKRVVLVRNKTRLIEAIRSATEVDGIIVHTLVSKELRQFFLSKIAEFGTRTVDIMGPLLDAFTGFFGVPPTGKPGVQRELSESYFRGIEAIEYTVNHDDGQDPDGLYLADMVIVGVSRTSKTPLSIFLSNQYFLKVANVPIILEVELPYQLFKINRNRVVGLTISAERLIDIRKTRIERTGLSVPPKYAEYDYIAKELEYSNKVFTANGWTIIDVTEKSIEEAASEITIRFF